MPGSAEHGAVGPTGESRPGPPGRRACHLIAVGALLTLTCVRLAHLEGPSGTQALLTSTAPTHTNTIVGGVWALDPPAACGDLRDYQGIIEGTEDDDVIAPKNGKQIILGLGGDDVISGANGKDCLVGGDGNDTLYGGNAPDIMVGGDGFDTCNGGHAPDTYECEAPLETMSSTALSVTPDEEPLVADPTPEVEDPGSEEPESEDPDSADPDSEDPAAEGAGTEDPAAPAPGGGSA